MPNPMTPTFRPTKCKYHLRVIDSMVAVLSAAREATEAYRNTTAEVRPLIVNRTLWKLESAVREYDRTHSVREPAIASVGRGKKNTPRAGKARKKT